VQFKHIYERYGDEAPYVEISSEGSKTARMSSAYIGYKEYDGEDPYDFPCYPEEVEAIQFMIHTNEDDYSDFDFCISDLRAIVE
jgi:hypothetical protein